VLRNRQLTIPPSLAASLRRQTMSDKVYMNSIRLEGKQTPSLSSIPHQTWQTILNDFFFKLADNFAFKGVLEKKDLFPKGLTFFENWDLQSNDLLELDGSIVCKFQLNDDCRQKLLNQDFSVHEKGMNPPRDYREYDEDHYYYEFDELYFFSADRLIGVFINHEDMIQFKNLTQQEYSLLLQLDKSITVDIIDDLDLQKSIQNKGGQ
jgi:hypothetical protein